MTAAARKARFDAGQQRHRALLAKVHIAAKELGLAGDAYADVLFGVTGKESAKQCSDAELGAVLDRMKALGWQPARPAGRAGPRAADHPSAKKARALWISLHHLGVVENPSEQALEAFAARQLKCERLQWANQGQAFRLIEALKDMAERHGWSQSTAGVLPRHLPVVLRRRLIERIVEEMKAIGLIPASWSITVAAWRLAGIQIISFWTAGAVELDEIAQALGAKLRAARAALPQGETE
jgi:phage gp16-like protein